MIPERRKNQGKLCSHRDFRRQLLSGRRAESPGEHRSLTTKETEGWGGGLLGSVHFAKQSRKRAPEMCREAPPLNTKLPFHWMRRHVAKHTNNSWGASSPMTSPLSLHRRTLPSDRA